MKNIAIVFVVMLIISSCKQVTPADNIHTAAINFTDAFIEQNIPSTPSFRVKGKNIVKNEGDSIYFIKGSVEGFSSFNVPVSVKHFNATLHYFGGDPNEQENWECLELYIGNKKMK